MDPLVRDALQELYKKDRGARAFFDWVDTRKNGATSTTVEQIEQRAGLDRASSISLAKALEAIGCAQYVVGRRGKETRVIWSYGLKEIASAALSANNVSEPTEKISEDEQAASDVELLEHTPLSISAAKPRLAAYYKVPPEAIEILIRG